MGDMGEPLTDEQIAEEEKFLAGLPRVNLGALFLAPVWGPAHGMWAAFLFFVAWLFADNVIYAATKPAAMSTASTTFSGMFKHKNPVCTYFPWYDPVYDR